MTKYFSITLFIITATLCSRGLSQAPGVAIEEQSSSGLQKEQKDLDVQIQKLISDKKSLTLSEFKKQIDSPVGRTLNLASPSKKRIKPHLIARRAQESSFRVGVAYLCGKCDKWHTNFGSGYAITSDGVLATCAHVIDPEEKLEDQTLVAVNSEGIVFPVVEVVAYHDAMDAALVRIDTKTTPLAFNDLVRPGDESYCFSRPLNQKGYFSTGIVNRFYWKSTDRGSDEGSLKSLAHLRINVSTDWAPGSSGSPILDRCGNVIGHVSEIRSMNNQPSKKKTDKDTKANAPSTLITLHIGIPARSVRTLALSAQQSDAQKTEGL